MGDHGPAVCAVYDMTVGPDCGVLTLWAMTNLLCVQCMTDIMTVDPDGGVLKLCVTTYLMCVECLMDSVGSWCGARN